MKLPLLIGLRPKHSKQGGLIPLGVGRWRVTANQTDSVLGLTSNETGLNAAIIPCEVNGPVNVRVIVLQAGTEEAIDSFAEREV